MLTPSTTAISALAIRGNASCSARAALAAAIPGDEDAFANGAKLPGVRDHQNGPAGTDDDVLRPKTARQQV